MIVRATGLGWIFKCHSTCGRCKHERCPCNNGFALSKYFSDGKHTEPVAKMLAENFEHRFQRHKKALAPHLTP